ncbi:MAG: hypothetical protein H7323_17265 [Frankiales bacterium]|nr:hypothetical protein [Frankiales bacterium]
MPEPVLAPVAYAVDPLTGPLEALAVPDPTSEPTPEASTEPTWPCATCGAANALTLMACAGCDAGFLSGLREAEGSLLELPFVGDLGALPRAQRLGLAAGAVGAVLVLVLLLGLLFS